MHSSEKIKVADLNNLLTCMLCKGYYVDATTITECLHSFCRTCIAHYLQDNECCPKCKVQVHTTRQLKNIRSDQTLQDIVYKLVPNLFKNEMKRRRLFYSKKEIALRDIPLSSEKRGDIWGCDRLIFTPDDVISVSLEYFPLLEPLALKLQNNIFPIEAHQRYFRCPGALKVRHLKKLLRAKYNVPQNKQIDILYMHDFLKNEFSLVDLAYIYAWKRSEPLRLFYKVTQESNKICSINFQSPERKNDKEIFLPIENNCASPCSTIICKTPSSAMATALSSRQSSRPPSPQMAEEPKDISLGKPNCAAMQSIHNPNAQTKPVSKPKLKSVFKKPISNSNSHALPELKTTLRQKCKANDVPSALTNDFNSGNNLNLVHNCYDKHFKQKLPKYNNRSPGRLKSADDSSICNIIHMRNRIVSNKSS